MNDKINGVALEKFKKLTGEGLHGNHPAYDKFVQKRLEEFLEKNPSFGPADARKFLETKLIPELGGFIDAAKGSGQNLNSFFKNIVNPANNIK